MPYEIYTKTSTGAWSLYLTADTQEEAIQKYADTIKYTRIEDVLLTEDLPYTVTYNSQTKLYTANYENEEPAGEQP